MEYCVMAIAYGSHATLKMSAYGHNTLFSTGEVEVVKR